MWRLVMLRKALILGGKLSAFLLAMVLVLIFSSPGSALGSDSAEEVKLSPSADTFVSSLDHGNQRNTNFGSAEKLKVVRGKKDKAGHYQGWKGTLIRFDLSSIPKGAEVLEARLFLFHFEHEGEFISIHRMEKDWAELGATWFAPCGGSEPWWGGWGDGNYRRQATDTQKVKRKKSWYSWGVTEDVRSFLKGTRNYGWFLKSARSWGRDWEATEFYSKESRHQNLRPYLRIRYRFSISPLMVKITSPLSGAILQETPVEVMGTISDPSATLTVNGILASISGDTFQASVSLLEGKNTVTARATDRNGQTASDSIEVTLVTKGSIAGVVRDSITGAPLASASVSVTDSWNQPQSALTGADGRYQISNVVSGAFSGKVRKDGYSAYDFSGTMTPGQTVSIDADLNPILPVIGGVSVSDITSDSATIHWVTDMPSDSLVDYGESSSYGNSVSDSALKTAHEVALKNLVADRTYHFRVISRNGYGFSSSSGDNTFKTLPPSNPITLTITTPKDGDTISRSEVRVEGTVSNALNLETGVTVNGILAQVYGDQYSANHVPLGEGSNSIQVVATDVKGNTQAAEIGVNGIKADHYIRVTADVDSGIVPLEPVLTVDSDLDLTEASLSGTGPGGVELISRDGKEYRFRISAEGAYRFTAQVSDPGGVVYEDSLTVVALSREQVDSLLKGKWEGVRTRLAGGDIEGSLDYFSGRRREQYGVLLNALVPVLPRVVQEMSDIQLVEVYGDMAVYDLRTVREGVEYSFQVLFTRDQDGIWRITSF